MSLLNGVMVYVDSVCMISADVCWIIHAFRKHHVNQAAWSIAVMLIVILVVICLLSSKYNTIY